MRYIKKINIITILIFIFTLFINYSYEIPLSQCTKGRFSYIKDSSINSGTCSLSSSEKTDIYPTVINSGLFNTYTQCGVCYEMIGPVGAVKLRVVDSCDKNSDNKCIGDISHFKVGTTTTNKILGTKDSNNLDENKTVNITFRMISCDYTEKIQILTGDNDDYTFSFVVLNNNIAISSIRLQENGSDKLKKLTREKNDNNYWIYDPESIINYPLTLKIISISDETVNVTVTSKESEEIFEGDGNFNNPNGYHFNVETLKRDKDVNSVEKCCSYDFEDFSPLYYNGKINQNYEKINYNVTISESSSILYDDKNTMKIKFLTYGKLILKSNLPIRADQYVAISIELQGNKICKDCLYISSYGKNADNKIQIKKANTFNKYIYNLDNLGIEDNTFNGIVLYTIEQNIDINIANIELLENSNAPSAELCADGMGDWTPVIPPVPIPSEEKNPSSETNTDTDTEDITTSKITEISDTINLENSIDISNETYNITGNYSNVEINIINMSSIPNMNTIIDINCEPFNKIENETVKIIFTSINNNNNNNFQFETKNCIIPTYSTIIESFRCEIPALNTIPNNIYKVESSPNSRYIINYPHNINIENGNIIFNYIPPTQPDQEQKPDTTIPNVETISTEKTSNIPLTDVSTEINPDIIKKQIVVINSIEKTIIQGENIVFNINPISINDYNNLNLNQIILLDQLNINALYLKNCKSILTSNNNVNNINCQVSRNLIKSSYTSFSSGQNIILDKNQKINLTSDISIGGSFSEDMLQTINANISQEAKNNYTLNFNVKFYGNDANIQPNKKYPYNIILYGIKKNNIIRQLQINNNISYNSEIIFNNCTLGSYSSLNNYIDGIKCNLPNFVSAGTYSKLESEGFDVNPNKKFNIEFPYDFNKSENYITQSNSTYINRYNDEDDDDSSSKEWIIWLVLAIVCVGLIAVIVIACIMKRRKRMKNDSNDETMNKNNINNSNNNDNSLDKIDDNKNKKENSISQSS